MKKRTPKSTSYIYISVFVVVSLSMSMLLPVLSIAQSPRNLIAYWRFNGDYDDATGNGHDGRKKGNVKFVKSKAPVPDAGQAVQFAGQAGNAVEIRNSDGLRLTDELSLMAWVNPDDAAPTQFCCGVPYDAGGNWDNPWVGHQIGVRGHKMATWLTLDGKAPAPGGRQGAGPDGDDADWEYDAGQVIAGEWNHIAFIFTGSAAISYVNGDEVANHRDRKGKIGFDGKPIFVIGERSVSAPGEPFGGMIDEVALFDVALTRTQLRNFMNNSIKLSVAPGGKSTTTWGTIKSRY